VGFTVYGMSKERTKSRPVSFRVPVEAWGAVTAAAEAEGLSPGKWAEQLAIRALAERENAAGPPQPYTGRWGAEAAMPTERDQTPGEAAYQAELAEAATRRARLEALADVLPEPFTQ